MDALKPSGLGLVGAHQGMKYSQAGIKPLLNDSPVPPLNNLMALALPFGSTILAVRQSNSEQKLKKELKKMSETPK